MTRFLERLTTSLHGIPARRWRLRLCARSWKRGSAAPRQADDARSAVQARAAAEAERDRFKGISRELRRQVQEARAAREEAEARLAAHKGSGVGAARLDSTPNSSADSSPTTLACN